jgi:hypothetical protein
LRHLVQQHADLVGRGSHLGRVEADSRAGQDQELGVFSAVLGGNEGSGELGIHEIHQGVAGAVLGGQGEAAEDRKAQVCVDADPPFARPGAIRDHVI